jgi:hypothetical protein
VAALSLPMVAPELVGLILSGLVVLYAESWASGFRGWVDRNLLDRLRGLRSIAWDWRAVALPVGVVFVAAAFLQSGPIACSAGEDDTLALFQSGRALLALGNPFLTYQCGHAVLVPYGLASAILDALGSLGGRIGIWLVWNLLALLLVPLTWSLALAHRWYATVFVGTSAFYAPLVVGSIQGGHSAIVPVTALLGLWFVLRRVPGGGALAGFLSTVKFPSLFPFWGGLSGVGVYRTREFVISAAVFAGASLLLIAVWGSHVYTWLFGVQLVRADFSINEFGVLIPLGAMPPAVVLTVLQGVALLGAILYAHLRRWATAPAVALLTVVVALVAQRFTANFLIWLLPVALLGPSSCRWLFAIGAVGLLDATVAVPACLGSGLCTLSEGLAGIMGLLLVLLLVHILREGERSANRGVAPTPSPTDPVEGPPAHRSGGSFHFTHRLEGPGGAGRRSWPGSRRTPRRDG